VKLEYQIPPYAMAEKLWNQGFITPLQFFRIAAWKSAQVIALDIVVDTLGRQ
jgi:hypothetical protein